MLNKDSDQIETYWGIATSGVLLSTAISSHGVDPFYPNKYNSIAEADLAKIKDEVDGCQGRTNAKGVYYYSSASTCIAEYIAKDKV